MEVYKYFISNVFGSERRYVIPLFQRPYVWSLEDQWLPLWQDISHCADKMFEKTIDEDYVHFLGAIVIQNKSIWGDQIKSHDVIDGQQRLTTFQIFIAALRNFAKEKKEEDVFNDLKKLTLNSGLMEDKNIETFKIWPTTKDREHFCYIIKSESIFEMENKYPLVSSRKNPIKLPKLIEAYWFFHESINQWVSENGESSISERIKILRRAINKHLQLVSIELSGKEDPQAIFESLNARGVPLLASDLIKNYIFQKIDTDTAHELHAKYWIFNNNSGKSNLNFWDETVRQGRLLRPKMDLFLQYYLTMHTWKDVPSIRLFVEYKNWVDKKYQSNVIGVEENLNDLSKAAKIFQELFDESHNSEKNIFFERLRIIEAAPVYPLVLFLMLDKNISKNDLKIIFIDLESFLVRRLICNRTSKNYNKYFLNIGKEFARSENKDSTEFRKLLMHSPSDINNWPTDQEFKEAWLNIDAYEKLKSSRVEMILLAMENFIHTLKNENIKINQKLTVEHIMPQSWQSHWPLPDTENNDLEERRNELIHDFGNLTLLTQSLNSSISNGPANLKLEEIAKQSLLKLNAYFQDKANWDESDIIKRSHDLFDIAIRIWPRPSMA